MAVTRQNHQYVSVDVSMQAEGPMYVPRFRFEVHKGRAAGRPVCKVSLGGSRSHVRAWRGSSTVTGLVLPLGHDLRVRVVAGEESRISPVFRPRPSHPVAFSAEWRTDAVMAIARQMYDSQDFAVLPILADAHSRTPGATTRRS